MEDLRTLIENSSDTFKTDLLKIYETVSGDVEQFEARLDEYIDEIERLKRISTKIISLNTE